MSPLFPIPDALRPTDETLRMRRVFEHDARQELAAGHSVQEVEAAIRSLKRAGVRVEVRSYDSPAERAEILMGTLHLLDRAEKSGDVPVRGAKESPGSYQARLLVEGARTQLPEGCVREDDPPAVVIAIAAMMAWVEELAEGASLKEQGLLDEKDVDAQFASNLEVVVAEADRRRMLASLHPERVARLIPQRDPWESGHDYLDRLLKLFGDDPNLYDRDAAIKLTQSRLAEWVVLQDR
jgi:hypothetical protein